MQNHRWHQQIHCFKLHVLGLLKWKTSKLLPINCTICILGRAKVRFSYWAFKWREQALQPFWLFWFCSPSPNLLHAISVNDLNTFDAHAKHTSWIRDTSSQKLLLVLASPGYMCSSPGLCQHPQPGPTALAAPIPEGRPHITDQQQQMQVVPTSCKHPQGGTSGNRSRDEFSSWTVVHGSVKSSKNLLVLRAAVGWSAGSVTPAAVTLCGNRNTLTSAAGISGLKSQFQNYHRSFRRAHKDYAPHLWYSITTTGRSGVLAGVLEWCCCFCAFCCSF